MPSVYVCIRPCFWRNRAWKEGEHISITDAAENPPRHFVAIDKPALLADAPRVIGDGQVEAEKAAARQEVLEAWYAMGKQELMMNAKALLGLDLSPRMGKKAMLAAVEENLT